MHPQALASVDDGKYVSVFMFGNIKTLSYTPIVSFDLYPELRRLELGMIVVLVIKVLATST